MAKKSKANYVPNKNIKSITKPTRKYSTYEKKVFVINNLKEFKQLLDLRANQKTFTPEPTNYPATYIIENGKLVHKGEFGKMKYEDGGNAERTIKGETLEAMYKKGFCSGDVMEYSQPNPMEYLLMTNNENRFEVNKDGERRMIGGTGEVLQGDLSLTDLKAQDKYEDGGNFEEFLNENEENDNWYDNSWFYGQYKDNKFTFQVENERGDFVLEPMETTIYDMISRINKLKDGERAVFSNHESIERKQGNFIYHYGDGGGGGGKRKIVESKIKDIVIDGIRSDVRDYYQQMPVGSMYANGGGIKSWQSKPLSYKINLFKAMGYSNSAAKQLASESLKSLKNEDEYGDLYYEIVEHLKSNKYAKGGGLRGYKYVPKYNIENVELTKGNKTVEVDGADLINGLYIKKGKYAKGGGVGSKLKEKKITIKDIKNIYSLIEDNEYDDGSGYYINERKLDDAVYDQFEDTIHYNTYKKIVIAYKQGKNPQEALDSLGNKMKTGGGVGNAKVFVATKEGRIEVYSGSDARSAEVKVGDIFLVTEEMKNGIYYLGKLNIKGSFKLSPGLSGKNVNKMNAGKQDEILYLLRKENIDGDSNFFAQFKKHNKYAKGGAMEEKTFRVEFTVSDDDAPYSIDLKANSKEDAIKYFRKRITSKKQTYKDAKITKVIDITSSYANGGNMNDDDEDFEKEFLEERLLELESELRELKENLDYEYDEDENEDEEIDYLTYKIYDLQDAINNWDMLDDDEKEEYKDKYYAKGGNMNNDLNEAISTQISKYNLELRRLKSDYRGEYFNTSHEGFLAVDEEGERIGDWEFYSQEFSENNLKKMFDLYPNAEKIIFSTRLNARSDEDENESGFALDHSIMEFDVPKKHANGGNMNNDKSYICTYEIGGL